MTEEFHLEPGIYEGVPWSDYVRIPYMSPSTLKHGLRSMKRLKRAIDGEIYPSAKTVAVGQVVHCLISGEDEDRIAAIPDFAVDPENVTANGSVPKKPTSTTFYKDAVKAFREKHEGKDVVTTGDFKKSEGIVERLMSHKHCAALITKSKQEITVIGEIEGVKVKTRLDGLWSEGQAYGCWDLKTTSDIAPDAFYRLCKRLGYLFQFGFHNAILAACGVQIQRYDVIGAEVQDDFDVGVIQIQPFELLDEWSEKVHELLGEYRICLSKDYWPGLYDDRKEQGVLSVPNWDMADKAFEWKEVDDV